MDIFIKNGLIIKKNSISVICDPHIVPKIKTIIITHVQENTFKLLASLDQTYTVFLSLDLLFLLQKLQSNSLIDPISAQLKTFPYEYSFSLYNLDIIAYPNYDGYFGSFCFIIDNYGICSPIGTGKHSKRIKKWKKVFKEANLSRLYFIKNKKGMISDSLTKNSFLTFLKNNTKVNFNFYNPERIFEFSKLATDNNFHIRFKKDYLNFLNSFYHLNINNSKNNNYIVQIDSKKYYFFENFINSDNLYSEIKNYIQAKQYIDVYDF